MGPHGPHYNLVTRTRTEWFRGLMVDIPCWPYPWLGELRVAALGSLPVFVQPLRLHGTPTFQQHSRLV